MEPKWCHFRDPLKLQILKDVPYGIKEFRVWGFPKSTQKAHQKLSRKTSDLNQQKRLSNKCPWVATFSATGRATGHSESVYRTFGLPSRAPCIKREPKWCPRAHKYIKNCAQEAPSPPTVSVLAASRLLFFTGVGGMSEATK